MAVLLFFAATLAMAKIVFLKRTPDVAATPPPAEIPAKQSENWVEKRNEGYRSPLERGAYGHTTVRRR